MDNKEKETDIPVEPVVVSTKQGNFYKTGFVALMFLLLLLAGGLAYGYFQGRIVFSIPLSVNDPAVLRTSLVYAFKTKVVGVEEKNGKTILKTDLAGSNIPEFVITNNTKIVIVQDGTDFKASKGLLRPETPVYLYLSYNIKTKQLLTTRVAIVDPITTKIKLPDPLKTAASASGKLKPLKK